MSNNDHLSDIAKLQERIKLLEDKVEITDLLNSYAKTVDMASADHVNWPMWETYFTEDCVVTFPFGTHKGRNGLSEWGKAALASFQATHHLSGNFQIELNGDKAKATTNIIATHLFKKDVPNDHFTLAGVYEWEFLCTSKGWKIKALKLSMVWTEGNDTAALS